MKIRAKNVNFHVLKSRDTPYITSLEKGLHIIGSEKPFLAKLVRKKSEASGACGGGTEAIRSHENKCMTHQRSVETKGSALLRTSTYSCFRITISNMHLQRHAATINYIEARYTIRSRLLGVDVKGVSTDSPTCYLKLLLSP